MILILYILHRLIYLTLSLRVDRSQMLELHSGCVQIIHTMCVIHIRVYLSPSTNIYCHTYLLLPLNMAYLFSYSRFTIDDGDEANLRMYMWNELTGGILYVSQSKQANTVENCHSGVGGSACWSSFFFREPSSKRYNLMLQYAFVSRTFPRISDMFRSPGRWRALSNVYLKLYCKRYELLLTLFRVNHFSISRPTSISRECATIDVSLPLLLPFIQPCELAITSAISIIIHDENVERRRPWWRCTLAPTFFPLLPPPIENMRWHRRHRWIWVGFYNVHTSYPSIL